MSNKTNKLHTADYLKMIGVADLKPFTSPFDPGYDPITLESHLEQSAHLISILKISMACWQIADEKSTRKKITAAIKNKVKTCTGGGPFEVAVTFGKLDNFLDLVADLGIDRIEAGEGFTDMSLKPADVISRAHSRGLEVQFELGKKHGGAFSGDMVKLLIDQGKSWLDAGAKHLVIEGRESAENVGVFGDNGELKTDIAEQFVEAFGLPLTIFEAPNKQSQFAMMNHFGAEVHLCNVRIEELLRVEIYRRGLHSDAFQFDHLRPKG